MNSVRDRKATPRFCISALLDLQAFVLVGLFICLKKLQFLAQKSCETSYKMLYNSACCNRTNPVFNIQSQWELICNHINT